MQRLKQLKTVQAESKLKSGSVWNNEWDLVFTNQFGGHLTARNVWEHYKKIVKKIGVPELRFHDLRHSYAVAAIQSGDDIKTVQESLGHHTAAFTLDVYGHVTDTMKAESAARMSSFIQRVSS